MKRKLRKIKFRVWTGKKILDVTELRWSKYADTGETFISECSLDCDKYGRTAAENGDLGPEESDTLIFLQFTGLKDKNGVDIYEGDILRGFYDLKWEVRYIKGSFAMVNGDMLGHDRVAHLYDNNTGDDEIIGNIYENPEIIKRQRDIAVGKHVED